MVKTHLFLSLGIVLSAACISHAVTAVPHVNLIKNPGFEKGSSEWKTDPARWQVVSDVSHSGRHSLRIENDDKASYTLASQPIPCVTERVYRMKVRIRTDGVEGADSGATICLEWYNKEGQYLGGSYPPGIKGTNEWTLLEANSKLIPEDAATMRAVVYLRQGCTGTAWFDDVSVELTEEPGEMTFRPMIRYPNYRHTIFPWQSRRLETGAEIKANRAHRIEDLALLVSVVDSSNRIIGEAEDSDLAGKPWASANVDLTRAKPGDYRVVATLRNTRARADVAAEVLRFRIADEDTPKPAIYVDEHNRCVVNGKLFFPVGMYIGESPTSPVAIEDLDKFSGTRFNCLMMYGINNGTPDQIRAYLNEVYRRRLKLIYSVKDLYFGSTWEVKKVGDWSGVEEILHGVVSAFRDHPALLAWYLNDELTDTRLPEIADHYEKIAALDPNHPIWQVLYLGQNVGDHVSSSDTIGIDHYPVPAAPITNFYIATSSVERAVMGARAIWMVPQGASQGAYSGNPDVRQPTYEETMCMSYLGLIHGARGLIYYSFFDLKRTTGGDEHWEVLKKIADEMARISPIVLGLDVPAMKRLTAGDGRIHVLTREVNGEIYALAANPQKESAKSEFRIGPELRIARIESTGRAAPTSVNEGFFTDEIESYGVRVYKLIRR